MGLFDYSKITVLLTDGGARQTLTILRELKELGCRVEVLCPSKNALCYSSRFPDVKILNKDAECTSPRFFDFVLSLIKTRKYDVLMPVGEITTNILTLNEDTVSKYTKLACTGRESYSKAFNKQITFEKALEVGVPCPYTRVTAQDPDDFLKKANYPIIIKPRSGMGSIGFHKFDSESDFITFRDKEKINIDDYVLQEFVNYSKRVSVYVYMDDEGIPKTSMALEVLRWYPLDAGTAVLTGTISNSDAVNYSISLLKGLNYKGFADVGFMEEKGSGELKLLEINGRIPAGIKLSWACGINIAKQIIDRALGLDVDYYTNSNSQKKYARHSQVDLMWFIKSKDRFRSVPSWFSWKDTTDLVFWKDDPVPFVRYTFEAIRKARSYGEKRKH